MEDCLQTCFAQPSSPRHFPITLISFDGHQLRVTPLRPRNIANSQPSIMPSASDHVPRVGRIAPSRHRCSRRIGTQPQPKALLPPAQRELTRELGREAPVPSSYQTHKPLALPPPTPHAFRIPGRLSTGRPRNPHRPHSGISSPHAMQPDDSRPKKLPLLARAGRRGAARSTAAGARACVIAANATRAKKPPWGNSAPDWVTSGSAAIVWG